MALTTIDSAGTAAVRAQVARSIEGRRTDVRGRLFEALLVLCLLLSLAVLALLLADVWQDGAGVYPRRGQQFLNNGLSSDAYKAGIAQGLIGSFWIAVAMLVSTASLGGTPASLS